jgi:AcrR family transcriptional regulator
MLDYPIFDVSLTNIKLKTAKSSASSPARQYEQTVRAQSTEETGRKITDAFLARLMKEWFDEITLDRIAHDAGVTVQTVIRRFGGKEGLLAASIDTLAAGINAQRAMPTGDIDSLVKNLFADYERTGDAILRFLALEPRYPALKQFADIGRRSHRQWLTDVLAPHLADLDAGARQRAIDSFVIVTDVYTWKLLRRDMGRSLAASMATVKSLINGVISEISSQK